LKGLYVVVKCI